MKITIKLVTLISVLFLIHSCKFNSKENDEVNSSDKKNKTEFNAEEEFLNINNYVEKKNTDRISTDNYTYWLKNGKIIKLHIFEGDGENYVIKEDYYFKDDKVFAYQKENIDFSNAMEYKALIFYSDSKINKEDYWVGDVKNTKSSVENQLKRYGLTIQDEIILDKQTNKPKGSLTLLDLSKRFNFNYQIVRESGETKETENISNSIVHEDNDDIKTLKEIKLILLDATQEKAELLLGKPDDYNKDFFGHITIGYSIYYNKVKDENGQSKNLVLFLRKNAIRYSVKTTKVEEIYAVGNGEKACFGIHCITVNN